MKPASNTPEGTPNRCPVCGKAVRIDSSLFPTFDAPCPHCGHLLWFVDAADDSVEFRALLTTSLDELERKHAEHQAWGLGSIDEWCMDQELCALNFSFADNSEAVAPVQIIGSFSINDNSWLWAWDNPSIADELKLHALHLKEYGELHGLPRLTSRNWTGTALDAWAMAALAVKLCDAQGAFRGPAGLIELYMTFGEVEVSKR